MQAQLRLVPGCLPGADLTMAFSALIRPF